MRDRFIRFMAGRYGTDSFNRFLFGAAFAVLILSFFIGRGLLYYVAIGIIIYGYFRMFSRNISARYQENERFLKRTAGLRRMLRINKKKIEQRKEYSFFKCPVCEQQVRVPKGRGHILITCPRCRHEFEKTT